jgi:ankyrin repeat protein
MIVHVSAVGDMALLRQLARRAIPVTTAEPLFNAARFGKLDVVRLLLRELEADVSLLHSSISPLYVAASDGHEHVVRALVQEFCANVHLLNDGTPALCAAVKAGQSMSCDVNQTTTDGVTALSIAARMGHEKVVKDFGANVNHVKEIGACFVRRGAGGA